MDPVSNDTFIREKLVRFVDFLKSVLKKRMANARFTEFSNKIEELRTVDTAQFILHVTSDMVPFKSNIGAYVDKLLKEQNVEAAELLLEEKNKLCRYIECFIDIVSQ